MNNAAAKLAYTHNTYASAIADVKRRKEAAGTATWDAGEGFTGQAKWCAWRKRVVQSTITPAGDVIVA